MSRLYEALQRADLERKASPTPEAEQVVDPEIIYGVEEPQSTKPEIDLEQIAQRAWKPSIAAFPTLADRGEGVEQFRSLRSRIFQARYEAPLKTILISSGMPAEGKSFIAANLAMSLARNSVNNILLIDGDLRRPTIHSLLGAPNAPGLSEYLAGTAELPEVMQRDRGAKQIGTGGVGGVTNLTFIPAGICGDNSSELVANHRMEKLIATVSPHFDWILIDSPPVLAVTDAVELSHAADAVLLIARGERTPYDVAQRAQAAFSNSRILGFVLNDVKEIPRLGYNYDDYYRGPEANIQAK
ncbi:MAG: CpsD/CapB family tyrosine-protein kinase [Terracidiphilus sp.]|jgi:capsular exopolysaccharide synthesis family protein